MSKQNTTSTRVSSSHGSGPSASHSSVHGSARGGRASEKEKRANPRAEKTEAGPPELDRVIHERLRLGILSALAVDSPLTFNDLKKLLKTTDGNLSVHARKLEEAEYISCEKSFDGRVPRTEYKMTTAGRRALEHYLDEMEAVIKAARRR